MANDSNQVKLSDAAHSELGITTQVASFYLDGLAGYPELGNGLEVTRTASIHSWTLSREDADIFVQRVEAHRAEVLG